MSTRPQIEHPTRSIGAQNAHVLDSVTVVYRAALMLAEEGYTVMSVHVEGHAPVIRIAECARCKKLHGVPYIFRRGPAGSEREMVALVHGAQVRWTTRQHH
jgi:hypothetical protein